MKMKLTLSVVLFIALTTAYLSRKPATTEAVETLQRVVQLPEPPPVPSRKDTAPKIEVKPAPETIASALPKFEPTKEQATAMELAQEKGREWTKRREDFFQVQLKLTDAEEKKRTSLSSTAEETEKALMESSQEDEEQIRLELIENRTRYEQALKSLLGNDRWTSYLSLYGTYWKVKEPSRVALHLPLK